MKPLQITFVALALLLSSCGLHKSTPIQGLAPSQLPDPIVDKTILVVDRHIEEKNFTSFATLGGLLKDVGGAALGKRGKAPRILYFRDQIQEAVQRNLTNVVSNPANVDVVYLDLSPATVPPGHSKITQGPMEAYDVIDLAKEHNADLVVSIDKLYYFGESSTTCRTETQTVEDKDGNKTKEEVTKYTTRSSAETSIDFTLYNGDDGKIIDTKFISKYKSETTSNDDSIAIELAERSIRQILAEYGRHISPHHRTVARRLYIRLDKAETLPMMRAKTFSQQDNWDKARAIWHSLLEERDLTPNSQAKLLTNLAIAEEHFENYDEALALMEEALFLDTASEFANYRDALLDAKADKADALAQIHLNESQLY